jgi:hypothetical protein
MKKRLIFATLLLLFLLPSPSWAVVAHTHSDQGFCGNASTSGNVTAICSGATTTFTYTASATNEAVLFGIGCAGTAETTVTLTASGWTTTQLSGPTGASGSWIASFGAIAPNTTQATFTITWSGSCANFINDLVDEFSGNDTTGGTTTFDAHNQGFNASTGQCSITVTPANNNDGLWGACQDSVTAVGSGFTKGADDTSQDWSEWQILSGGSGVGQTVNFTGTSGQWEEVGATIKPSGGAAAQVSTNKRQKYEILDP